MTQQWWISTSPLGDGGKKVLGPFDSQETALTVRTYLEHYEHCPRAAFGAPARKTYWIDDEMTEEVRS